MKKKINIETEFEIGQEVFYLKDNGHAARGKIQGINVKYFGVDDTDVRYHLGGPVWRIANQLFTNRDDLATAVFEETKQRLYNDLIEFL